MSREDEKGTPQRGRWALSLFGIYSLPLRSVSDLCGIRVSFDVLYMSN